jgi:purine-binding chemotaxis protein CheW
MQLVSFRLQEQLLGLEILLVREINRQMESTSVQLASTHIIGLANLRGQIVTIFDLAKRLGMPAGEATECHNIVLKTNGELAPVRAREEREDLVSCADPTGLRVDAIGDIIEVKASQLEPTPANLSGVDSRFLSGVVTLDQELMLILDLQELLKDA